MKRLTIVLSFAASLLLTSCNWFKQKTKDTVHKAGEVTAKAGSEFADGVAKGVEKTFENEVSFSDELSKQGLKAGRVLVLNSDSATDNVLSAYLIFDADLDRKLIVKVFDEKGLEYGRLVQQVTGHKGEARYVDFIFDKRTNIDGKGKLTFE